METEPAQYYVTESMDQAAFLLASGCPVVRTRLYAGRWVSFSFLNSAEVHRIVASFSRGGTIEARAYAAAFHEVRKVVAIVKRGHEWAPLRIPMEHR